MDIGYIIFVACILICGYLWLAQAMPASRHYDKHMAWYCFAAMITMITLLVLDLTGLLGN